MFFEPFETTADIFDLINSSSNNTDTKMAAFNQSQNTQPLQHPVSSSSSYQGKLGDSLSTSASGAFFDDYSTDSLNNSSAAIVPDMHAMPLTPEMPRSRLGQQHLQHPPQQQQSAVKDVVVPKLPAVVQKAKAAAQAAISSPSATAATLSPAATPASTAAGAGTSPRTTRRRRYKYYTPSDDEDDEQAQTPGGADATDDDDSTHSSSSSAKRSTAGAGNSRRKAKPVVDLSTLDADEAKAEKNRQSARDCRLRKKKYIQSLEKRLKDAEEREKQLQDRVRSLEFRVLTLQAENVSLQPATCIPSFAAAANNEPMSPTMREALRIVKMDD